MITLRSIVVDEVLELCELVKAVIVQHKRLINIFLLVKEEEA